MSSMIVHYEIYSFALIQFLFTAEVKKTSWVHALRTMTEPVIHWRLYIFCPWAWSTGLALCLWTPNSLSYIDRLNCWRLSRSNLEERKLTQRWIHQLVKDWNVDEDEGCVDDLHLVREDHDTANLPVHTSGLEGPTGTLQFYVGFTGEKKNPQAK